MTMTMLVDGREIEVKDEKNILEVVRKAGVDLPTFCYHSELSIFGACRMCMVEDGRGKLLAACATPPADGLEIRTNTPRLMHHRRMILELLLANHNRDCTTCEKNGLCRLQDLAERMNIKEVRFPQKKSKAEIDISPALIRDTSKCILCGDCVRVCEEIQGVGVLGFAHRGNRMSVMPAFGKKLNEVACVNCGQCASVCPTGALTIKSDIDRVWEALQDPEKKVVVQVAPAVRVAFSEAFGMPPGSVGTGELVAALRRLGFDKVYDTSFTADLTVQEEFSEFMGRLKKNEQLPLFTSCCPAWIKFAEQYYPTYLKNISSCRSPQAMFGAVAKAYLPEELDVVAKDLYIVSIMPCTAKKFEADRRELSSDGIPDVDVVLTTQELVRMVREANIDFRKLPREAFDLPMGIGTGAGIIFGATGGVSEAVLRTASRVLDAKTPKIEFKDARGFKGCKESVVTIAGQEISVAIVHGLANAHKILKAIENGKKSYHIVEVMACPGGCIGGGGQPLPNDSDARIARAKGLYDIDRERELRCSDDNPSVERLYQKHLDHPGSSQAEKLLHTHYSPRRRMDGEEVSLGTVKEAKTKIQVCVGTSCFLKGAYDVLQAFQHALAEKGLSDKFDIGATFCLEQCDLGPNVNINGESFNHMTPSKARELVAELEKSMVD